MSTLENRLCDATCVWCGKKNLFLDSQISLLDPIGVRISCRNCGAKGPIGDTPNEAFELYLYGPSTLMQKQNKKSIVNAILIGDK